MVTKIIDGTRGDGSRNCRYLFIEADFRVTT